MKFMSPICFELSQSKSYPVVGNDGLFFASCPIHCRFMLSLRFVVFFFSGCGGGGGGGVFFVLILGIRRTRVSWFSFYDNKLKVATYYHGNSAPVC